MQKGCSSFKNYFETWLNWNICRDVVLYANSLNVLFASRPIVNVYIILVNENESSLCAYMLSINTLIC